MKHCLLALLLFATPLLAQPSQPFTYQGTLLLDQSGVNGELSFDFSLWDALQGGQQVGQTLSLNDVDVLMGRFSVELDFGNAAFDGNPRWLQIEISDDGSGGMALLDPRQRVTPTPYALRSLNAASVPARILSNLPSGANFTINLTGLSTGTGLTLANSLIFQQDFNESGGIYGQVTLDGPLRLRRQLSSDQSWRAAFLAGQSNVGVQMQLLLPGGNVRWEFSNAVVSGWGLPVADDGLPMELLELTINPTSFQRSVIGSIVARPPPSLGLDRGLISGFDPMDRYQLLIDGNRIADYRVIQDALERPFEGSSLVLRQNPTANPALVNWFTNQMLRPFELEVVSASLGTFIPVADNLAYATEYTLRLADDGLPIEEVRISYRP